MTPAENIFVLSVHMVLGVSVVLLILIGYLWVTTKDTILGLYALTLLGCLIMAIAKKYSIAAALPGANIMENSWPDEIIGCIFGGTYMFFFGWVFHFQKRTQWTRLLLRLVIAVTAVQFFSLLYQKLVNGVQYFNSVFWLTLFSAVSLIGLLSLIAAFTLKNKTPFQKVILAGGLVFYILVMLGNLQEYFYKSGKGSGINVFFFSLLAENIFFTLAVAQRIKEAYQQSARQKIKEYQYQLEIEQVINYFATAISAQYSIDDMLWDVSKNLIGKLGFEECMIYLWNDDKTILIQRAGYGLKGDMRIGKNKNMYHIPKGKGIVGAAVQSGKSILVNDTSKDTRYFSADEKIMFSELCVPIIYNNEVIGVINTEHSKKRFFTQRHLTILTTIASLCAEKIAKINAVEQAREKEIELLILNKDLATSQLTALRSQMNPHFLFNAMNSIQQFILKGDIENANRYISKFSVLLRKVLYSSKQDFITIDEETELLGLYLDIEQLRMGENFFFTIKVDEEIETDACKIPCMLLQPFVENALKHGLALKEGEKRLEINFSFYDEQWVMVQIGDNGIGRTEAEAVKLQQNKMLPHESKGIELIKERLQLLGALKEVITMEDKINTDGTAAGTLVKVLLPLQFSVQ